MLAFNRITPGRTRVQSLDPEDDDIAGLVLKATPDGGVLVRWDNGNDMWTHVGNLCAEGERRTGPTIADTARSLLAYFGTLAEWGSGTSRLEQSVPSPELAALCDAILATAPAAWRPYGEDRDNGYLILACPNPPEMETLTRFGLYHRTMTVHDLAKPPGWTATPNLDERTVQMQAVVGLLVGLASGPSEVARPGRSRAFI